jgi:hypothetical protein
VQTCARPPWAVPTQSYHGSQDVNPFAYWPQPVPFNQDTIRTPTIDEPGAVEKDPVVFTGLEKVWVTVDKVGIPTFGLDGTGSARPPTLAPAPQGSDILEETDENQR